jgi:hypothetical protein
MGTYAEGARPLTEDEELIVDYVDYWGGEKEPSCNGHGTLEILEAINILENDGISCCIVGISALIYYGAGRIRHVRFSCSVLKDIQLIILLCRTGKFVCQQISSTLPLRYLKQELIRG